MTLAIFDLDNTLIGGDSDHLWCQFVQEQALVDSDNFVQQAEAFYSDYERGDLDIMAYLRFALSPLKDRAVDELNEQREQFVREKIRPIMLPRAAELLQKHREADHELLIITATNEFVTRPIADILGVPHLIACQAEILNGVYTGEPIGVPSFQTGKVSRLHDWLAAHDSTLPGAWFYSDSHNDLALLSLVDNPVAVDPDDILRRHAEREGWQVITLRD